MLTDAEMAQILTATQDRTTFSALIQFLAYSAQRRTQVGRLQRAWIDFKAQHITWPKEEMKADQPHTIPLTPELRRIIHRCPLGQYPFQKFHDWDRAKKELAARLDIPHWVIHDIRRYFSTTMSRLGVPIDITEIDPRARFR